MNAHTFPRLHNGDSFPVSDIPELNMAAFRDAVSSGIAAGCRVSALFGVPAERLRTGSNPGRLRLFAVMADDRQGMLGLFSTSVANSYPSLTPECPQVHWFEREIAEQWKVTPRGHPWLKPIRFHPPLSGDGPAAPIGVTNFFQLSGSEAHEVAVGPVHAGVIEPGHFRFQCYGEIVHHLEISLGYQHRGVERALIGGPDARTLHYMETLAGDTTIGHATAWCGVMENLSGTHAPPRADALRGIALELERLANHTGDLGALAGDVAYLPTASFCGRIRGDFLNLTALLCGNRFGRGMMVPGGVHFDLDPQRVEELDARLAQAAKDVAVATELLWRTTSVLSRFEDAGIVSTQACIDLGLVGPAARAGGVDIDVRRDFPAGIYRFSQVPVSTWNTGDVFARAFVRWLEIQKSIDFIRTLVRALPDGPVSLATGKLRPGMFATSLVEGWRGEICHVAITDADGRFAHYKVIDPSFHNWMGLAMALRGRQISDFPLCNKSFNLSYCGHDL